jgi:LuxR family maltose regulon positive regulatory protein
MTTATASAELIEPKMHRPSLAPDHLPRMRLVDELAAKRHVPLVLITGPAGYGKTTLLSAWLASSEWPAMWVSLDEGDNNLRLFVQYIVAAIQGQFSHAMQKTAALLHSITLPEGAVLTRALINDLDQIDQPCILALDDYHVITAPVIHDLITQILRHPPRDFHLAICSRHDPLLPLSAMRAKGQLAEIRMESLRFNKAESVLLLKQLAGVDLPPAAVASVSELVDGWPAGLRVAALSLRHNPNVLSDKPQSMPAYSGLMSFLFDEVLTRAPLEIQNFLVRTSILNTLTPALCEAEVGRQRAYYNRERCLDFIIRNGLFVNPIDADERVYRYHHLFQKLLQAELKARMDEGEIAGLHSRASDWFAQQGQPDEALHYALAGRDYARATRLVARFRHQLMNNDEWQRLEHWINQFPREVIASTADLVLAEAFIAYTRFRRVECNELTHKANALVEAMPASPEKNALRGEISALLAQHYFFETIDFAKSEDYANLALKLTPHDRWSAIVLGWAFITGSKLVAGDTANAYTEVYRSLSEERDQGDGFRVRMLAYICFLHTYVGDLSGLLRVASEALKHEDTAGALLGRWITHINWARYHKGVAHYHRNELAEAEACFATVVAQRYQSHVHCAVQSMFALSLTHQAMGRPDAAREMADLAAQYALEMRCTTLFPVTQLFQAQLALQQGRMADAVHLLAGRELPAVLPPAPFFFAPFMSIAKVRLAEGTEQSLATAEAMLERLRVYAEQLHNPPILMDVLALEALLAESRNEPRAAQATLERALMLAQTEGFVRLFADKGPRMADLLSRLHSKKVSPAFLQRIQEAFAQPHKKTPVQTTLIEPLTEREQEVLSLLQKRMSTKEIAAALYITPGTVKRHTHVIFQKLDVHTRREAVLKGEELKLLPFQ